MSTTPAQDPAPARARASLLPLPADALVPEVLTSLQQHPNLIVEAAPGTGKTTRIPPALLAAVPGQVWVLEPRRLAARMAARRVADEKGEPLGETVGYRVRFDEVTGPRTRLVFVTEGILTRRMQRDPDLLGVDAVVLDEFHERHVDTDLALALLRHLQVLRPTLRLLVMSATLDTAPIARFLGGAPVLQASGRMFPVTVTHRPYSPDPLELQVVDAVRGLVRMGNTGHTLVFLPGLAEIRRAMRACEEVARSAGLISLPLHGDLSPEEQDRAVGPSRQPKLIFATNVAESSVTVEGVTAVVDSGLARRASHSPWTGLPTLEVTRISKASARQRAGRAGRTGPGQVLRLYPEEDFAQRPEQDPPEILRSDLTPLALALRSMGLSGFGGLHWLDPPSESSTRYAEALLDRLGAAGSVAQQMARLPLPPRIARMLVETIQSRASRWGLTAAAVLARGERFGTLDLLEALDQPLRPEARREREALRRLLGSAEESNGQEDDLLRAVLTGYPDRVAKARSGQEVQLSTGSSAEVVGVPPPYRFMIVLDAEDRPERGLPLVRLTARIEPEWLLDLFPDRVEESVDISWNRGEERVERVTTLRYDQLTLEEWHESASQDPRSTPLLVAKTLEAGLERFVDGESLANLLERIAFAGLPAPEIPLVLAQLCQGLTSFAELAKIGAQLLPLLEETVGRERLRTLAPDRLRLPKGREVRVHYEPGKPPWIASRLQDFFGMQATPKIGPERVAVVAHLLAPNMRAVQTTNDLAGFWQRLYPQVRRELMRRYPRHAWPERPE